MLWTDKKDNNKVKIVWDEVTYEQFMENWWAATWNLENHVLECFGITREDSDRRDSDDGSDLHKLVELAHILVKLDNITTMTAFEFELEEEQLKVNFWDVIGAERSEPFMNKETKTRAYDPSNY